MSCSSAGVPPTEIVTPRGGSIARSSSSLLAASLRTSSPFCSTGHVGVGFLRGVAALVRRDRTLLHCGSVKPLICAAFALDLVDLGVVDVALDDEGQLSRCGSRGRSGRTPPAPSRTGLSGGRYFSLIPPSASCPIGMISSTMMIEDRHGEEHRPLHHPVDEPAPEAVLHLFAGLGLLGPLGEPVDDAAGELASCRQERDAVAACARPARRRCGRGSPSTAGSTVIDSSAASDTDAMIA